MIIRNVRKASIEESDYLTRTKASKTFDTKKYEQKHSVFGLLVLESDQVNILDVLEPPVRRKVSHFIYTCFCLGYDMIAGISCKACYRTADAARA